MFANPVIIFQNENEAALISRFVELSALYPDHPVFDIAQYVFRELPDAATRANQAALVWSNDLEIKERIRKAKLNGGAEPEELTEEELRYREAMSKASDPSLSGAVQYKYFELACKIKGYIKEAVEAAKGDQKRVMPTIIYAQKSPQ